MNDVKMNIEWYSMGGPQNPLFQNPLFQKIARGGDRAVTADTQSRLLVILVLADALLSARAVARTAVGSHAHSVVPPREPQGIWSGPL